VLELSAFQIQVTNKWAMQLPVPVPGPFLPTCTVRKEAFPSGVSALGFMLTSLGLISHNVPVPEKKEPDFRN